MQTALVMTIIGPDRPGLVDSVASVVAAHGGNWLESRMSRLASQFAGILRVEVPRDREEALCAALQALESGGLSIVIQRGDADGIEGRRLAQLQVVGHDRPGIVRQISHVLAERGVNVEELSTERGSAPMSGELLFTVEALLRIPDQCSLVDLRADLERIAGDLMVDLAPLESEPAAIIGKR